MTDFFKRNTFIGHEPPVKRRLVCVHHIKRADFIKLPDGLGYINNFAFCQTFSACSSNVILMQYIQHTVFDEKGDAGKACDGWNDNRQKQMTQRIFDFSPCIKCFVVQTMQSGYGKPVIHYT